jgi:predicted ATP-grasp superfamily ATP-dependent carboligase
MQKIHNAPTLKNGNMTPVREKDHQMKHICMKCLLYVGITGYFGLSLQILLGGRKGKC